jgi:protein O-GlcNAc transferase
MATTPQAFETAFAHHRAGRIAEAAALYQQVLQVDPRHVDALHLLGVAVHQSGQHEVAVGFITKAIELRGDDAAIHANLGEVYCALGKLDQAARCYQQAVRLEPDGLQRHLRLGDVYRSTGKLELAQSEYQEALRLQPEHAEVQERWGLLCRDSGNADQAVAHFEHALQIDPNLARAYNHLAITLRGQGRLAEALECYQRGLQHHPQASEFHFGLGVTYQGLRLFDQAVTSYQAAIRLNPRYAMAHNNLGAALKELGRFDEALACYRAAIAANPDLAESYFNTGIVHAARREFDAAITAYREAIKREPDYVNALISCGGLYEGRGQLAEAQACYQHVVQTRPEMPIGHFSCGNIFRTKLMPAEAVAAYQEAIRLQPDYADAYNNLAALFVDLSQPDAAEKCCRKGLEFAPRQGALYSNLATALLLQGRLEDALEARRKAIELHPHNPGEHSNLVYDLNFVSDSDPQAVFDEHLQWARRHAEPLTADAPPNANAPDPDRKIRVGYVSAFFRAHAVNYFTEPILRAHEHDEFEIYCYSDVLHADDATGRIKDAVDGWRDVYGMSDADVAQRVCADQIDILVDLTGHIGTNRLPLFARKPAPVQVTYIGYQNTTGMSAMDYRLTDDHADPPGETDRYYTETLVRLPRSFFCYRPPDDAPPVGPLPAIEQGFITFGSFNKFVKITRPTIESWLKILSQVPDARLMVLAQRGGHVENRLHVAAAAKGIDPTRIELFDRRGHTDYMKLVARADIALDPFPFNGHTTTCDALWMGVPVVTWAGRAYASRYGSSAHRNVGLNSWIAGSAEQYVEIAVRAAGDRDALALLRSELRQRMADSPLLDFEGFTRNLEGAYRQMWRTWCAQRP